MAHGCTRFTITSVLPYMITFSTESNPSRNQGPIRGAPLPQTASLLVPSLDYRSSARERLRSPADLEISKTTPNEASSPPGRGSTLSSSSRSRPSLSHPRQRGIKQAWMPEEEEGADVRRRCAHRGAVCSPSSAP